MMDTDAGADSVAEDAAYAEAASLIEEQLSGTPEAVGTIFTFDVASPTSLHKELAVASPFQVASTSHQRVAPNGGLSSQDIQTGLASTSAMFYRLKIKR